MLQLVALVFV